MELVTQPNDDIKLTFVEGFFSNEDDSQLERRQAFSLIAMKTTRAKISDRHIDMATLKITEVSREEMTTGVWHITRKIEITVVGDPKPRHFPEVRRVLDLQAFNNGTTFRSFSGDIVMKYQGGIIDLGLYQAVIADSFPLKLIWEPDNDLSWKEIRELELDPDAGCPPLIKIGREDGVSSHLMDGVL